MTITQKTLAGLGLGNIGLAIFVDSAPLGFIGAGMIVVAYLWYRTDPPSFY